MQQTKHRILVVDDDKLIVVLAEDMLQGMGYATLGATSGAEALRLVATFMPEVVEVVIVDFNMPDMNGAEFTRRLREQDTFKNTPVLGMSGSGSGSAAELTLSGADLFIAKPLREKALQVAVARLLEHGRLLTPSWID